MYPVNYMKQKYFLELDWYYTSKFNYFLNLENINKFFLETSSKIENVSKKNLVENFKISENFDINSIWGIFRTSSIEHEKGRKKYI